MRNWAEGFANICRIKHRRATAILHFVTGWAGSGKSLYIRDKILGLATNGGYEKNIMLIVPEQFSFETERSFYTARENITDFEINYYKYLGALLLRRVDILSFKRLAHRIFLKYGGLAGDYADDIVRNVVMSIAIEQIKDELKFYKKSAHDLGFTSIVLDAVSEFKNAGATPEKFREGVDIINSGFEEKNAGNFADKLNDLSLIYAAYDAMLAKAYKDPLDDISRGIKKVEGRNFFKGHTVFFDEFKGFTAVQYRMIRTILQEAEDVYISLCLDENDSLFEATGNTYKRLKNLAREVGVKISAPKILRDTYRFKNPALKALERDIFNVNSQNSPNLPNEKIGPQDSVITYLAENEYDEADFVISKAAELVKTGYRYKDIVILSRNIEGYKDILEHSAEKYEVPFFMDMRKNIDSSPLFRFVTLLLSAAAGNSWGGDTDSVLAMLKCPVLKHKYRYEKVAEFENYIYTWGISFRQFSEKFTGHPGGFKSEFTEHDIKTLEKINKIRENVFEAVSCLKDISSGGTAEDFGRAILNGADILGVYDYLKHEISEQNEAGFVEEAEKLRILWDTLVDILERISHALQSGKITLKKYENLFKIALNCFDMGSPPQTLDAVTIGSAERVRTGEPKIVFILGANEGNFPLIPKNSGVFTDEQRKLLHNAGIEISASLEDMIAEEKFIAYQTLCRASDKLYITAAVADISGAALAPSAIFCRIRDVFNGTDSDLEDISGKSKILRACQNKAGAFTALAENFRTDTEETAALREIFKNDSEYSEKLERMYNALKKPYFKIENNNISEDLFGKNMKLSPSRVEKYYKCPFSYYCETGLSIKSRKKAELNPLVSGTLLHDIIYRLTNDFDGFLRMTEKEIKAKIREELNSYLDSTMGGDLDKTKRFLYLYRRIQDTVLKILLRLKGEFENSEFVPVDFELEISENGEIPPVIIPSENGEISISGKIDRVDVYEKDGIKYVRVVDYKSGSGKNFKLDDINHGLNLQMLFYLFAICRQGKYQGAKPAGVLYYPIAEPVPSLKRNSNDDDYNAEVNKKYKPSGLLLDDKNILEAMEKAEDGKCIYIPVKYDKKGNFTKSTCDILADEKKLSELAGKLDSLVLEMHKSLLNGGIEATPVDHGKFKPCEYCEYAQICGDVKSEDSEEPEGDEF